MGLTRDTPLILKDLNNNTIIKNIGDIPVVWFYNPEHNFDEGFPIYKIWSCNGWKSINKIIRYKTDKDIYKLITKCGSIFTDDPQISFIYGELPHIDKNYDISSLNMIEKKLLHYIKESDVTTFTYNNTHSFIKIGKTQSYMYKLETDSHYYHAGISNINVANNFNEIIFLNSSF